MTRYFRHLIPVRIGSQIAALVVASLLLAHAIITATFLIAAHPDRPMCRIGVADRLIFLTALLDSEPNASARSILLAAARRTNPDLKIFTSTPPSDAISLASSPLNELDCVGDDSKLFVSRLDQPQDASYLLVVAKLSDGSFIALPLQTPKGPPSFMSPPLIGTLAFLASAITILSLWAARQLTAPLARLADAAEQFTMNKSTAPLAERGPLEVRRTARALNDMQQRVLKLIADRTRMLAAVGHDLRTPITRLRLRADEIEPEPLRAQFLRDLTIMQNLVQSALSLLRGQFAPQRKVKADAPPWYKQLVMILAMLLSTVAICRMFMSSVNRISSCARSAI